MSFDNKVIIWNNVGQGLGCQIASPGHNELSAAHIIAVDMWFDQLIEAKWDIYVSVQHTNIASDNGLSPGHCQAIIWTNAAILAIWL